MASLMALDYFYENENYFCGNCGKEYEEDELANGRKRWKCKKCNVHLDIRVTIKKQRIVLNRLFPNELNYEDQQIINTAGKYSYELISCEKDKKDRDLYVIALREYRTIKQHKDTWLNVRIGVW